jgi:hypothetical protein
MRENELACVCLTQDKIISVGKKAHTSSNHHQTNPLESKRYISFTVLEQLNASGNTPSWVGEALLDSVARIIKPHYIQLTFATHIYLLQFFMYDFHNFLKKLNSPSLDI